jgi:hypothetical protein
MSYKPVFEKGSINTLLLEHSFHDECLDYADAHSMNVLYTETTSTASVKIIHDFQKRGYSHKLFEVPYYAPGGIKLDPQIYCLFSR